MCQDNSELKQTRDDLKKEKDALQVQFRQTEQTARDATKQATDMQDKHRALLVAPHPVVHC